MPTPNLELLLGHMGETLLWRLDARTAAFGGDANLEPAEVIRRNVGITTPGMFSDPSMACALQGLGNDAVVFPSIIRSKAWPPPAVGSTRHPCPTRDVRRYRSATRPASSNFEHRDPLHAAFDKRLPGIPAEKLILRAAKFKGLVP